MDTMCNSFSYSLKLKLIFSLDTTSSNDFLSSNKRCISGFPQGIFISSRSCKKIISSLWQVFRFTVLFFTSTRWMNMRNRHIHNFNMLQIFRTCTFGKDDLQCFIQSETTFFLPDRDEMKIPCGKPDMQREYRFEISVTY
jgi:hypothetical protein